MRHKIRTRRLGVKSSHRTAMLRNMAAGLVEHGRIRTTLTRAKVLRSFVEKLVTKLKDPSVANIRYVRSILPHKDVVLQMVQTIAPAFKNRAGGYTRILRLSGRRAGDAAEMALIEWVEEKLVAAYQEKTPAKKIAKSSKKAEAASVDGEAAISAKKKAPKKSESTESVDGVKEKKAPKKTAAKKKV